MTPGHREGPMKAFQGTEFMCEMPPLVVSLAEYIPSPVSLLAPGSDPQFWPEHSITALLQIALRYIGITQG